MRKGRPGPIHWFVVTNSSDSGIGSGTFTTNNMLKLLGRQDVMPNVARNVNLEELETEKSRIALSNPKGTLGVPGPLDETRKARIKALDAEIESRKKDLENEKQKIKKVILLNRKKIVNLRKN
ncbi:Uncharacterised protein [Aggregatibacter aphrophilus]|uniref:Uncharacterized protein n=1 Tax=Aggregatibacter aphrophilus TaxID=732 RepID=A0A336N7Z1_AGGAP|nr:Uncharacterised protein [Aggregatibacter aphrophilus]